MSDCGQMDTIQSSIINDLSEGILTFGFEGRIGIVNPAAEAILGISREQLQGKKSSTLLFYFEENDQFNQTILDAIYDTESKHVDVVPYFDGKQTKTLHVSASFLHENGERSGVIVVISDITEMVEMERRHLKQVNSLIDSMVKTLSTTIDERSHYTGRHTQHMVSMGEAFLDWLKETGNSWKFDENRRRALLMSIWLHDVGKIAIPVEIMDKATRLGPLMENVEERFKRIALLERIALLVGRRTQADYDSAAQERMLILDFVRSINTGGFVTDEMLAQIERLSTLTYEEEDGRRLPLFTAGEIEAMSIRKGTLTDEERRIMQSHAALTRKILNQVSFPPDYEQVPLWASSHHELLSGKGYPDHIDGSMIPREVQFITILDIFEALTAKDRPYKPSIPLERTWAILESMVAEGSLNGELLALFKESGAWQKLTDDGD